MGFSAGAPLAPPAAAAGHFPLGPGWGSLPQEGLRLVISPTRGLEPSRSAPNNRFLSQAPSEKKKKSKKKRRTKSPNNNKRKKKKRADFSQCCRISLPCVFLPPHIFLTQGLSPAGSSGALRHSKLILGIGEALSCCKLAWEHPCSDLWDQASKTPMGHPGTVMGKNCALWGSILHDGDQSCTMGMNPARWG